MKGRHTQHIGPEEIFRACSEIRWIALINNKGEVSFSTMRPGVSSLVPENDVTGFMEADRAKSILKSSEGLSHWAGQVEGVLIQYEKVFLYVLRVEASVLAMSIDRATSYERIALIAARIQADLGLP